MARRTQPKDGAPRTSVTPHAPLPSAAGSSGGDGGRSPSPVIVLATQPPGLTHREKECLQLAARGVRRRDIAALLGISFATTSFHLHNAAKKLGAPDVQTAIAWTSPDDVS
ncbi:MAG: helix-turn-helix domain-containing protein [Lysobacteraceae bacterium]